MAQFLASNLMLGLMLSATLAALGWWQRNALLDMVRAPESSWRVLAWIVLGLTVALILWFSLADDFRKVFGELLDVREKFPSQRAVQMPVDPTIRRISFALLIPTLLLTGALFARYLGGYGLQFVLVLLGLSAFFPLYLIRQRLDTGLAGILDLPSFFSIAMVATIFYLLLDYAANLALILTTYLGLLGLAAFPVTVILDLLGRREAPASRATDVADFYAKIRAGIEERRAASPTHLPSDEGTPRP
jgi:hypothetical protein